MGGDAQTGNKNINLLDGVCAARCNNGHNLLYGKVARKETGLERCKEFIWNLFMNQSPFAQIALIVVLGYFFLELMFRQDRKPETG